MPTSTGTPALLDHFTCYKASATAGPTLPSVTLTDQFGSSVVTIRKPRYLCAPTDMLGQDPTAPEHSEHEVGYQVKATGSFTKISSQQFFDEFGALTVDVVKPSHLLVPRVKSLSLTPPTPVAFVVDHFQCYKVKDRTRPQFVPVSYVTLADQFGTMTVHLKRPTFLCTPVDANGQSPGAETHLEHLMCYQAKQIDPVKFARRSDVFVDGAFGPGTLVVKKPVELCVPALREP